MLDWFMVILIIFGVALLCVYVFLEGVRIGRMRGRSDLRAALIGRGASVWVNGRTVEHAANVWIETHDNCHCSANCVTVTPLNDADYELPGPINAEVGDMVYWPHDHTCHDDS